ncbi:DUF4747 family protein [Alteromonas confluentis]|uniref:DUF4747 domain-containing protein n=1 Tax=Alteromonas confluentis TaxID=1656094 RepID=A0A1E7Z9F6_9ALTE|nr:DUF4747 family protein [Alteromonas confluentis]OFC70081.1 hypothetical protein BFC18_15235 [Alteromonas confluentis]
MKRKKMSYGAINITTHPHSPRTYVDLFEAAYSMKKPIKVYGDTHILMTSCAPEKLGKEKFLLGEIYKFTQIDMDSNWFNLDTNTYASDDEVGQVKIPDNLFPNSQKFTFVFYPEQHLIFYESYVSGHRLAPSLAVNFFKYLFASEKLVEKFGDVDVVHVPSADVYNEMMRLPIKTVIEMDIRKPNPDTFAKTANKVKQRMQNINAASMQQTYKAEKGESLEVDEEITLFSRLAAKTGELFIKGRDALNKVVTYSTKKHPMIIDSTYDVDHSNSSRTLVEKSIQTKESIAQTFDN